MKTVHSQTDNISTSRYNFLFSLDLEQNFLVNLKAHILNFLILSMFILYFEWKIKRVGLKLIFRNLCDLVRVWKRFTFQSTKSFICPEKSEMCCCPYFIRLLFPNCSFTLPQTGFGKKSGFENNWYSVQQSMLKGWRSIRIMTNTK